MSSTIPKPQLRNLHIDYVKRSLVGMVLFCGSIGLGYKFLISEPRKKRYADFYKTYDAEKQLQIMVDAGEMHSARTD